MLCSLQDSRRTTQLYVDCPVHSTENAISWLADCIRDVAAWMGATNRLRMNPQKTQLARFTTAGEDNNRGALQTQDRSPRLRPVASRNQSQTHSDATGLNCGDRYWICNVPHQVTPAFSVLSA